MSDRTHLQLQILHCPPDQLRKVHAVIEYSICDLADDEDVELGETYEVEETVCGTADEIAAKLQQDAPDAAWLCWEDPKYEWLGKLHRYTPELGLWSRECDANGTPLFVAEEVLQFTRNPLIGMQQLRLALGLAHEQALETLLKRLSS